jgi:transketolase
MSQERAKSIEDLSINVIRGLAIDGVERAKSGHPGLPMGVATIGYALWRRHMRHNPSDPGWPDRDRFVLSAGHGSMLLYALLHLTGYDLPLEELQRFRQWGSRTPGHPEYGLTPGVETTTGPLGQGFGNAVGMALAERWQAATYNRPGHEIVNHYTYVLASDGDLMEGVQSESASLAGHWGLDRLIVIYDANRISIDGSTDLTFTEDVAKRYDAYGWHVQHVDGHDLAAVDVAIVNAKLEIRRPSLIVARTHIGYGAPHKQDSAEAHGSPLGAAEAKLAKERLGLPPDQEFWVPAEVRAHMAAVGEAGRAAQAEWEARLRAHEAAYPELGLQYRSALAAELPDGWLDALPSFKPGDKVATRQASGTTLNAIATRMPWLIGGSADLSESNSTLIQGAKAIQNGQYGERYIHFGVREHGMGAILNGLTLHGGLRCFGGTFLIFSDYMRPTIRLAALMEQPVIYVFTHDSVGLGEDGPTHQPIEQLMSLRLIPNLEVIRPSDGAETAIAWRMALERKHGPTALVLTRQKLPVLDRRAGAEHAPATQALHGGYVLTDSRVAGEPVPAQVILIGSGSEVHVCLDARSQLAEAGIGARVVSMPSLTRFLAQPAAYQNEVLPADTVRVAVEAGATLGWAAVVGPQGDVVGLDRFGASAPGEVALRELGFSAENVAERAREALARSTRTIFTRFSSV